MFERKSGGHVDVVVDRRSQIRCSRLLEGMRPRVIGPWFVWSDAVARAGIATLIERRADAIEHADAAEAARARVAARALRRRRVPRVHVARVGRGGHQDSLAS